jgi:transcriptional regulator with XRE-family HTH domain
LQRCKIITLTFVICPPYGADVMRDEVTAKRVAERLVALAGDRGLSQRALARQAGLPPEVVSRAFRGLHTPSVATLERLCSGLGISLAEFFADGSQRVAERMRPPVPQVQDAQRIWRILDELTPRSRSQALRALELLVRSISGTTKKPSPHRAR